CARNYDGYAMDYW
nr:immunoglobulin heavy chain junction region [Mus musculus]MBK4189360.1 immunoglobulin heavy chain junction region [Mus musculus]